MVLKSPMLRFLFGHGVIGGGAGIAIGAGLLFFDVAGLTTLSMKSEPVWLGPFLLCFSFFASFSALAMGAAVMSFGGDSGEDDGDDTTTRHRLVPAPQSSGEAVEAPVRISK
ncbi:hypothetical protein NUH88_19975 [Nisaea acidiphila]|uniref:Uncharacterized protein n=1 Tax=Nisaea acidiphila TaxID=1862145 RepID=A0A9J7AT50_9PROT|nr:hypothetical protein [Nisaea acidiphila]UUX49665.1 hypothetical protein NUH88_19975 [Nisaea acidiphila]